MAPPSFNTVELELLMYVSAVLIVVGSFLTLLFSVVFAAGLARLLYVSGYWCVRKIHHTHSTARERCMLSVELCRVTEAGILTNHCYP
jgi:hypothetical protein